jgi:hypothetical protein
MISSTGAALFSQGEAVFVRPIAHAWRQQSFTVIKPLWRRGRLPHYKLQAPDGGIWLVSQLELAASPIWSSTEGDEARPRRRRRLTPSGAASSTASVKQ